MFRSGDAAYQEALASMEEQLIQLYKEKAEGGFGDNQSLEMIKNLEAQLVSLYEEKESSSLHSSDSSMVHSMESQIISLLEEKADLEQEIHSLKAQNKKFKNKAKKLGTMIMESFFDLEE